MAAIRKAYLPDVGTLNTRKIDTRGEPSMPEDTRTVKERAWSALEKLAKAEQRRDPTLTHAKAVVAAMATPAGKAAVELYYGAQADQTVAEASATEHAIGKRRQLGFNRWAEAVDLQARVIADRDGSDYTTALRKVATEFPATWAAHEAEHA